MVRIVFLIRIINGRQEVESRYVCEDSGVRDAVASEMLRMVDQGSFGLFLLDCPDVATPQSISEVEVKARLEKAVEQIAASKDTEVFPPGINRLHPPPKGMPQHVPLPQRVQTAAYPNRAARRAAARGKRF